MTGPEFDASRDSFESIYQAVGDDLELVPWAGLTPHPELVSWLDRQPDRGSGAGRRAMVVACGLGDDAEELARRGFSVDAFDFSPTAIAKCATRFPDSAVRYTTADLLSLPPSWARSFDLVVEVNTVQSLPPADHARGMTAIANLVGAGGQLFVRCTGRAEDEPADHRPWPLSRSELEGFVAAGLAETSFVESRTNKGVRQFAIGFRRPAAPRSDT